MLTSDHIKQYQITSTFFSLFWGGLVVKLKIKVLVSLKLKIKVKA